ncbi:MAG: RNA polymerase sigma factor [Solirubrobacterales bacterium]
MEASPEQHSPSAADIGLGGRMLLAQPDAVLCKLATRGNANAYEVLYGRYHQPVFAFVYHLLARKDGMEDCEDIVQDTFAKAFAGIREKRVDGSFRSWIYTIARNGTFDLIRARKSNVQSLDAETTEFPSAAEHTETDRHAEQRVELAWMVAAVSDLPERQREALLMRELGGLSHSQIASQLDTTVSATKKLIGRARAAVIEAATIDGYRPRRLGRDLAMAAPVVPLTLAGMGLGAAAGGAFVASSAATGGAAAGGAAFGGKTAATVLAVVALGGGAAVAEHERSAGADAPRETISKAGPAAIAATASKQGTDQGADQGDNGPANGLPLFGVIDGDGERPADRARDDKRGVERRRVERRRGDRRRGGDSDFGPRGRDRNVDDDTRPARRGRRGEADEPKGRRGGGESEPLERRAPRERERTGSGERDDPIGPDGGASQGPGPSSIEPD